ncbi:uncharacterized protein LOC115234606 [Formica exsecta]|uniref:uncharacterized protein LOC115234606 n=1 Tax=Formica exsecta TaxID=72781 RepID=UPI0011417A19|nr:uncharacterized protein LOC115234606 [Formica exsecta]
MYPMSAATYAGSGGVATVTVVVVAAVWRIGSGREEARWAPWAYKQIQKGLRVRKARLSPSRTHDDILCVQKGGGRTSPTKRTPRPGRAMVLCHASGSFIRARQKESAVSATTSSCCEKGRKPSSFSFLIWIKRILFAELLLVAGLLDPRFLLYFNGSADHRGPLFSDGQQEHIKKHLQGG